MYLFSTQGIMLVYDITNEKSFDNIRNWIRNIEEVRAPFCFLQEHRGQAESGVWEQDTCHLPKISIGPGPTQ